MFCFYVFVVYNCKRLTFNQNTTFMKHILKEMRSALNDCDTAFEMIRIHGYDQKLSPQAVSVINTAWPIIKGVLERTNPNAEEIEFESTDECNGVLEECVNSFMGDFQEKYGLGGDLSPELSVKLDDAQLAFAKVIAEVMHYQKSKG